MQVQTAISYEELARVLGLEYGLKIDLVEVDRLKGELSIVVSGNLPPRTVTGAGFYPSPKHVGFAPDFVHINYLKKRDPA